MATKVFLSYSSTDTSTAEPLVRALQQHKLNVWFAPNEVGGGDYFGGRIRGAIRGCSALILLASRHSVGTGGDTVASGSRQVLREVQTADEFHKKVIPLALDDTLIQGCADDFSYLLALNQYIDIRDAAATGCFEFVCQEILCSLQNSAKSASHNSSRPLQEIESALKTGSYTVALAALSAYRPDKDQAESAELLTVIAQLQKTSVQGLNKSTADLLAHRLRRLEQSAETPAVYYVLGALSVHFYQRYKMYDATGGYAELHRSATRCPSLPAKYAMMMRHALPANSRFDLDWPR